MVSGRSDLNAYNQSSHIQIRLSRTFLFGWEGRRLAQTTCLNCKKVVPPGPLLPEG